MKTKIRSHIQRLSLTGSAFAVGLMLCAGAVVAQTPNLQTVVETAQTPQTPQDQKIQQLQEKLEEIQQELIELKRANLAASETAHHHDRQGIRPAVVSYRRGP